MHSPLKTNTQPLKLQFSHNKNLSEAGCDEAGRGCLAGPVVAAAVVLPKGFHHPLLNDSKQVSEKNRNILRKFIEQECDWAIGICSPFEIDEINILNASILAMHMALNGLPSVPQYILVDGNRFKPYKDIPYSCMVKGDSRFMNIAAASILAKTHRDEIMESLDVSFPQYFWKKNKGYPTEEHRNGIRIFGATEHHRKTFRLLNPQWSLFD